MATLHAFRALRPLPSHAARVASVPYDVVSVAEARELAAGNDVSFLHVVRPEIDLPEGIDEHDDTVYRKGAENLAGFRSSGYTIEEDDPALYVYRLDREDRSQIGIFGCVSVTDYDTGVILKHERTRPDKEDDRTRHIIEQRAHAEPVMLAYPDDPAVQSTIDATTQLEPLYDFVAADGVRHVLWRAEDPAEIANAFRGIPKLYVADGHHRCKAASRAAAELKASGNHVSAEAGYFPAALFPMSSLDIMPYNRVVYQVPGGPKSFLATLHSKLGAEPASSPQPPAKGMVCVYLDGAWYSIALPETSRPDVSDRLDVARLGEHLLEPLLGIKDPRRDPNIDFVGGVRGTRALEDFVESGRGQMAISMYPTSIEELAEVSDAGELMPPKSTWFEPKLRSGLLVHLFD